MMYARLLIIVFLFVITGTMQARESFEKLRNVLRQQQEDERSPEVHQFSQDINRWVEPLEQMGLNFLTFVAQCRSLDAHCSARYIQRQLRSLRRNCSELRGQLERLEIKYVGRVNEEELLMPTLRALRRVLQQYEVTLGLVNTESYKLVDQ